MRRDTLELADDSLFLEKACADDSTATAHKAAALLIEQDADAITVAAIEDLSAPIIPTTEDRQLRRRDKHVILSFIGSVSRKALLFITFRLLALQKAIGSSGRRSRKMAQATLDSLVPIADRLGPGDLRRRLEDTCFRLLSGIDTCTSQGNGFDPAGSMHVLKEDYNGKKLLRNSRGDIGRHPR